MVKQPRIDIRFGAVAEVGPGDVRNVASVEPERLAVAADRASHRPPVAASLDNGQYLSDVLSKARLTGQQAGHPANRPAAGLIRTQVNSMMSTLLERGVGGAGVFLDGSAPVPAAFGTWVRC